MHPPIGFILLTHKNPNQIIRLIDRLNFMFDNPPIVCHHDFSKCALPLGSLPKNVSFVSPYLETEWGKFSLVEGTAKALEQMYAGPSSPEWVVVLSAADYPIKPAHRIVDDLQAGKFDVHMDYRLIQAGQSEQGWQKNYFERYCTVILPVPFVTRSLRLSKWHVRFRHPLLTKLLLPYSNTLRCFAGSQWFSVNRRAAEYIFAFRKSDFRLATHCARKWCSDETYFQTILANARELRLNNENWRYIDWSEYKNHPKTLACGDFQKIVSSHAHFARKFDPDVDSQILDDLDRVVDGTL